VGENLFPFGQNRLGKMSEEEQKDFDAGHHFIHRRAPFRPGHIPWHEHISAFRRIIGAKNMT
jgi:hypothetical protein